MGNNKGFTLTELIVVMAIFIVVILLMSSSFENIMRKSSQQSKSALSQIEGVVGLEMFRTDISHAGYALPWSFTSTPASAYVEVNTIPLTYAIAGITPSDFNDAVPRAVRGGGPALNGSHYLVLKSGMLALNTTSTGRHAFVNYSGGNNSYINRVGDPNTDIRNGTLAAPNNVQDRVITLMSEFTNPGAQTRQLMMVDATTATGFWYTVQTSFIPTNNKFKPADASQTFYVYAISDSDLKMPFNRADYFIYRTAYNDANFPFPASCAPGTGILFKAVAGHTSNYKGASNENLIYPLLNCVGDMQVSLGFDPLSNGNMTFSPPNAASVTGMSADDFRSQLKEVRVYILAHEGKKDQNYSYPGATIYVGEPGYGGREWTPTMMANATTGFGTDWMRYRWKVYTLVVQMKNLQ